MGLFGLHLHKHKHGQGGDPKAPPVPPRVGAAAPQGQVRSAPFASCGRTNTS